MNWAEASYLSSCRFSCLQDVLLFHQLPPPLNCPWSHGSFYSSTIKIVVSCAVCHPTVNYWNNLFSLSEIYNILSFVILLKWLACCVPSLFSLWLCISKAFKILLLLFKWNLKEKHTQALLEHIWRHQCHVSSRWQCSIGPLFRNTFHWLLTPYICLISSCLTGFSSYRVIFKFSFLPNSIICNKRSKYDSQATE